MTTLRDIAIDLLRGRLPATAADDLTRERLKICEQCEYFTRMTRQCRQCGCFMDMKAKLLKATCPTEKW